MYKITKLVFAVIVFAFATFNVSFVSAQMETIDQGHLDTINKNIYKALGSKDISNTKNALRQWAYLPVDDLSIGTDVHKAIIAADWQPILDYDSGALKTFKYIRNIVNYILWFLWFIALIYLLYHWFIIVTTTKENKHEDAMKAIKTAAIAIGWIWVARFIVTFIYYVIWLITN